MFLKRFGSCMKKQLIRDSFILILSVILLYSCSSIDINARKYYDDCKNNYLLSEWMSFDVSCMFFKNKKFSHALEPARVVVHNNPNYVSIIHPDYAILLNEDSIVYVNKYYEEIAVYHNTDTSKYDFYEMLSGNEIGNYIDQLSIYSPIIAAQSQIFLGDSTNKLKKKKDHYCLSASMTVKYCTDKECYLVQEPIKFFFNAQTNILDSTSRKEKYWNRVQKISNISYNTCQTIIDSIFNINDVKYRYYSFQNNDSTYYIYSRSNVSIPGLTEQTLEYPLINVVSKDTCSIKSISGPILLCLVQNAKYELRYFVERTKDLNSIIPNIIYVNPYSRNIEMNKIYSDSLGVSNKMFCAKGLSLKMDTKDCYILISSDKKIVCSNRDIEKIKEFIQK